MEQYLEHEIVRNEEQNFIECLGNLEKLSVDEDNRINDEVSEEHHEQHGVNKTEELKIYECLEKHLQEKKALIKHKEQHGFECDENRQEQEYSMESEATKVIESLGHSEKISVEEDPKITDKVIESTLHKSPEQKVKNQEQRIELESIEKHKDQPQTEKDEEQNVMNERIRHLETRVKQQDDELLCLKSTLADVLRRLQQAENALQQQHQASSNKILPKEANNVTLNQARTKPNTDKPVIRTNQDRLKVTRPVEQKIGTSRFA